MVGLARREMEEERDDRRRKEKRGKRGSNTVIEKERGRVCDKLPGCAVLLSSGREITNVPCHPWT